MKNIVIGTAGHVDHGKTLLVKALTGIDTDRLKEEKKRGITIELGFAHMDLPNAGKVGIIDVPGHEKFIKNMLAGAGGIDIAMLIVAADEGVMPQTREHLGILSLLGIDLGVIVVTKTDMVEPDWLEAISEEIREAVAPTFLKDAPMAFVSAYTGQGIDELKQVLDTLSVSAGEKNLNLPPRIPVDRVFPREGFGTVITGTLIEGTLKVGDEVVISPFDRPTRVRNIQNHGESKDIAYAGQRVAVNLASVHYSEVKRGDVITTEGNSASTMMLDVKLSILPDYDRVISDGSRLHLHHGTTETICKLVLLDRAELKAGESAFAQLRLTDTISAKTGDRFVVRFYSPVETVGGGTVIEASPIRHKRFNDDVLSALTVKESGDDLQKLSQLLLEASGRIANTADIRKSFPVTDEKFAELIAELSEEGEIVKIAQERFIHRGQLAQLTERLSKLLTVYHKDNPLLSGVRREELRTKLLPALDIQSADAIIALLTSQSEFKLIDGRVSLKDFTLNLNPKQQQMHRDLLKLYTDAGYSPPDRATVTKTYAKDRDLFSKVFSFMHSEGELVAVSDEFSFAGVLYEKALSDFKAAAEVAPVTLAQFRDIIGSSRKYTVAILEYWDRKNITKMVGDARVLV